VFQPQDVHPNRPGIVAPVRVDPRGLCGPTRAQSRGSDWRRSSQGLYVPSWVDRDATEQRIVEAAAVLPRYGGVTGWATLRWWGGRWFESRGPRGGLPAVPLATGGLHIRPQRGVEICEEKLEPRDLVGFDGLRTTTPVRAVCFAMRYAASVREAVVILDMAAYSDLVSIAELAAYALEHPAWTGIPQCRDAIPYADENSWSPTEVDMRWTWAVEAGRPRPLCNRPVFDRRGRHVGTPDLLDPVAGVVGEYAGSLHLVGKRRSRDLQHEEDYRALGLEYVTMVGQDRLDPGPFITRLHGAYRRAARTPQDQRLWTIEPPAGWISTATVEQRRRLEGSLRERLLRYRRVG
jgi:hypothetical protein